MNVTRTPLTVRLMTSMEVDGHSDHEQIPEETARAGRIWRMLMLEQCRVGLVVNSAAVRRGGL